MESGAPDGLLLELDRADDSDPVLSWPAVFGNDHPVEVELGIGKGRFLLASAQSRPEVNFVGVEWAAKYLRIAHERGRKRGLHNLRLARAEAREFVEFFVPAASVQALHVYFPDPWPKKRHHKRRLMDRRFLAEVERVLIPGGHLWLATDHQEYFEAIQEALAACPCLREVEAQWGEVKTNYEQKYLTQGKPIYRRVLCREAEAGAD